MSQIFLYTKGAKIGNETRKQLREAGIIPVEVENINDARLLQSVPLEVDAGVLMRSAMRAVNSAATKNSGHYGSKVAIEFAAELTAALGREPAAS